MITGDSGYPQRPWIMTPYRNPPLNAEEELYNQKHSKARVIIENTFGRLKNRWRCCLKYRALHYKPTKCAEIIIACCVLHNFAIEYNVPDPDYDNDYDEGYQFLILKLSTSSLPCHPLLFPFIGI